MSTETLSITGGTWIDPQARAIQRLDLHLREERIVGLGDAPSGFKPDLTIDASGMWVLPGLVDLCAFLREPGQEHKADIASELRAAAAGGITTLCASPDRKTAIDSPAEVRLIQAKARAAGFGRVIPVGAMSRGLRGVDLSEMSALKDAGCVAVSNGTVPIESSLVLRRAMEYAASYDLLVIIRPEDPALRDGGCVHEGRVAMRLGLPGIPEAAETAAVAQALALAEHTGARVHFGQISCARTVEMLGHAQQRGLAVTADVAALQLFLTEADIGEFDSNCHVIPPFRAVSDRDALRHGLRDGVIAAICSDHQPHDADAKLDVFAATEPGASGLESLLPLTLRLVQEGLLDLPSAVGAVTSGPAAVLGLQEAANVAIGQRGNLCIVNPELTWTINPTTWLSRGQNTPLWNQTLTGKVMMTIANGKVVWGLGQG